MISTISREPKEHKSWHPSLHTLDFTASVLNSLHLRGACATALHSAVKTSGRLGNDYTKMVTFFTPLGVHLSQYTE